MGIKGLFTYIQKYVESSLEWHKLHDCKLVIDGSNLAYDLYNFGRMNSAFGGDYDKYATYVEEFFRKLLQCNVEPIVIMDGGRPVNRDKFRTVFSRMKNQIDCCYKVNPDNSDHFLIFPILGRAVFVNVIQKLGINVLQCDFEADDEIVVIAKQLNAYVLSNDSDFYLFNVPFILLNSINLKCIQKEKSPSSKKLIKFIPCHRFNHKIFSEITGIKPQLVPLLAPILGNDFMPCAMLKDFYVHIRDLQPVSRRVTGRHRIIISVIKWLSQETQSPSAVLQKVFNVAEKTLSKSNRKLIRSVLYMYFPSESNLEPWVDPHLPECPSLKGKPNLSAYASSAISRVDFKQTWFLPPRVKWELDCTCSHRVETKLLHGRKMPDWFVRAFRLQLIPPIISDILNKNYMFSIPQIEVTSRESVYLGLEQVVRRIRGILWRTLAQSIDMQCATIGKSLASPEDGFFLKNLKESKVMLCTGNDNNASFEDGMECDDEDEETFIGDGGESVEQSLPAGEESEGEDEGLVEDRKLNAADFSTLDNDDDDDDDQVKSSCEANGDGAADEDEFYISSDDDDDREQQAEKERRLFQEFEKKRKIPVLRWFIRKENDLWGKVFHPENVCMYKKFPTLFEVERLTLAEKKKAFYNVTGLEISFEEKMPQNIEFILFCICFWKHKHRKHVSDIDILSVLMCVLMFCVIDGKLGRTRSRRNFENVIESCSKKVKTLLKSDTLPDPATMSVSALIQSLTLDECQMANFSLYQFHDTDPTDNRKTYSRVAMHAFSEYQATVFFLQTLNSLLCFPFPSISVESFWSGTFCYNIRKCFSTNVEIGDLLSALFNKNTRIIGLFTKLCDLVRAHIKVPDIKETMEEVPEIRVNKARSQMKRKLGLKSAFEMGISTKKKKKKKKKQKKEPEPTPLECDVLESPTAEDVIMMAENRYSALLLS